jgi:hypothetical protein
MHCSLKRITIRCIDSFIGNCSVVILGVAEAERLNSHPKIITSLAIIHDEDTS